MALVSTQPGRPTPQPDFDLALRDFEGALSVEQQREFRSSGGGSPRDGDAIRLTTLIDKQCSDKRRQCMGARFMLFLDSTQQFYNAVDTFVSSHPETAALVWGGIKVTILVHSSLVIHRINWLIVQAANNVSSYFEKISLLFMTIGRQCHRMRALGSLYPTDGLQRAKTEYSTAVLRLCRHVITFLNEKGREDGRRFANIS